MLPSDPSFHIAYSFYVKVLTNGGTSAYFGPYELRIGCSDGNVVYNDAAAFDVDQPVAVGDSPIGVYSLVIPTSTRSWCAPLAHYIVNPDADGTDWTPPQKMIQC